MNSSLVWPLSRRMWQVLFDFFFPHGVFHFQSPLLQDLGDLLAEGCCTTWRQQVKILLDVIVSNVPSSSAWTLPFTTVTPSFKSRTQNCFGW